MQPSDSEEQWKQPQPVDSSAPYQSIEGEVARDEDALVNNTQESAEDQPADQTPDAADPEAVVRWQSPEYLQKEQNTTWYVVMAIVALILMAVAIFWMKTITFAILIPVMVFALVIYIRRPAPIIDYIVSRKGIHINDTLHLYDEYKAFGVLAKEGNPSIILIPRKRFQLGHTIYFPAEVGESLVDMLAARLPMKEVSQDLFDKIINRLHI